MTPIFNQPIPPASYEVILSQLCYLLEFELNNQNIIDPSFIKPTVWKERIYQLDPTEYPAINVGLQRGTYTNKTRQLTLSEYTYTIDVYTQACSYEAEGVVIPADTDAKLHMQKIMNFCRAIVEHPQANNLRFDTPFITMLKVTSIDIDNGNTVKDALSTAVGRIEVQINATENTTFNPNVPIGVFVNNFTTISLEETDNGFYLQTNPE